MCRRSPARLLPLGAGELGELPVGSAGVGAGELLGGAGGWAARGHDIGWAHTGTRLVEKAV